LPIVALFGKKHYFLENFLLTVRNTMHCNII